MLADWFRGMYDAVYHAPHGRLSKPQASDLTTRMRINRCLDHDPKLATVLSIPTRRTQEVPTMRGTIATRRFPLPPNIERTGMSSGDGMDRQGAPVGYPLNDEQWSDHLSDPSSH